MWYHPPANGVPAGDPRGGAHPVAARLRIATWNLQSDRPVTPPPVEAARRAMAGVDADVWVVTEPWPDSPCPAGYRLASDGQRAIALALTQLLTEAGERSEESETPVDRGSPRPEPVARIVPGD